MGAVGEVGEAKARGNAVALATKKAGRGFANEAVVFKCVVPAPDRVPTCADCLPGVTAGSKYFPIVQAVISLSPA
jgi:hypothetical protein